jgi:FG-GAP-like repeat
MKVVGVQSTGGCAILLACVGAASAFSVVAPFASAPPSFTGPKPYATGHNPDSVAIGDLNGDGYPDLVAADYDPNTVSVLANRGDGSFQSRLAYRTGEAPRSVAIGDLNGDGKPDLAIANEVGTVSVLINGGGVLQAKLDYATGRGPYSVAIGDLNGDEKPDLVTANNCEHHLRPRQSGRWQLRFQG